MGLTVYCIMMDFMLTCVLHAVLGMSSLFLSDVTSLTHIQFFMEKTI